VTRGSASTAAALTLALFLGACSPPPAAPRTEERRVVVTDAPKRNSDGYLFAVRSRLSSLGLLRADGFDRQATESLAKALAQALDACVMREFSRGALQPGATRVDVTLDRLGHITHVNVTSDPPAAHAGALLCVVSPLHAVHFRDGAERMVVLEALWGAPAK
jgi:hypothetical protein